MCEVCLVERVRRENEFEREKKERGLSWVWLWVGWFVDAIVFYRGGKSGIWEWVRNECF